MKTKKEIYSRLMMTLWELENTNPHENLKHMLKSQLEVLYWALDEEIDTEFQVRVEKLI